MSNVYSDDIWKGQTPVAASTAFSASCTVLWGLERLDCRPLWPWAERMLRKRTSLALKKATMKGCLSWGPLPVSSPTSWVLLLWPTGGDTDQEGEQDLGESHSTINCLILIWPQQPHSWLELCEHPLQRFTQYVMIVFGTLNHYATQKLQSFNCCCSFMYGSDWPWLSSKTRCNPRFCSGFTTQRLLVAVRSKTSQPSSAAQISRWSSRSSSTSLREELYVIT